jgi:hypothetical protein
MHGAELYHATPAARSVLAGGRWFEGTNALGRALDWARHAAEGSRCPMLVWRVEGARVKLAGRVDPA